MPLPASVLITNRYRIISRLGAGGMGEVYLAEDLELKRKVALKFLTSTNHANSHPISTLLNEARVAAALNHTHIATVYDVGYSEHGAYIVMEFVEGETLSQRLKQGALKIETAIGIGMQIAKALAAVHANGRVHSDIKSSNVMLTPQGSVKALDFGLAQSTFHATNHNDNGFQETENFSEGKITGTPSYMSPEQIRGETLDARSDIFSLGILLYEMLTNKPPFVGETRTAILRAICDEEPRLLITQREEIPLRLQPIVSKALQKKREERYQTATEFHTDLLRFKEWFGRVTRGKDAIVTTSTLANSENAFRGLSPFQEGDEELFFGREKERDAFYEMVTALDFRFGVLWGESGSGKTSLIKASLLPALRRTPGFLPLYCRPYRDPLAALRDECRAQCGIEIDEAESLPGYLRRVTDKLDQVIEDGAATLIIIYDQFEEFFAQCKAETERQTFVAFVTACYEDSTLPVKFFFSLRGDFLQYIQKDFAGREEESERIPNPLNSSRLYELLNFSTEQAAGIINDSARKAALPITESLSRAVAEDLTTGDNVLPSELQIVGLQLQKKRIFTVEEYQCAGGKESLVYSFLEEEIRASGDKETAEAVLQSLISDENRRLQLAFDEIVERTGRDRERVQRVLQRLVHARLVQLLQGEEPWHYELMHEYLIDKLNRLASQSPNAKQRANLQLRQYLSQYSRDESIRIPLTKLWSIKRHADLKHTEQEKKLLKRSLRSSLLKASGASFFVIIAAILLAAYLSVREEWDEVRLRDGHTAAVRRAIFSPDGKRIVSVGEDKQVIVWDFERRERIATLTDHTDWVTSVAFSPDGKWFATGSRDTTVIVWNAVRLEKVKVLREHRSEVCSLAFSPDGRLLASASTAITTTPDNRTVIWKVGQWEKVHELHVGSSYQNILFSPNSHWLLSSSEGQIWDLTTGQEIATTEKGLGANWRAVSPDATRVVNIDGDGNVFFWEMKEFWQTGQYKLLSKHRAHHDNGRTVAISPDGKLAATGSENIILWDVAMQTILSRFEHEAIVWSVDFSPDGRWLVSSHGDGSILLWNVTERKLVANFNEHGGAVRAVAYSLDGKRIATASEDNSVIIWDAETRRKKAALVGHETKVTAIAFSPDNGSVASCDFDGKIIYWRVAERRPLWTDKLNSCNAVAFSPDGRWVATTRGLYETANGRIAVNLNHMLMHGLAFSSDGKWLVYASALGKLSLLEVGTWKVVEEVIADNHSFISVSFSPDSQWLVTGEDEKNVRLWSVRPLCEVAIIGTHARRIKSVAFSPDGRQVASASDDQTIALWDVWGRKLISQIGTHPAPVLSVAFSPDGKRLVSGEHDRAVRLYTRHSVLWGYRLN